MNPFERCEALLSRIAVVLLLVPAAVATPAVLLAQEPPSPIPSAESASQSSELRFSGYADLHFQRYDFYQNVQDVSPDRRGRFDLQRFVIRPSKHLGRGWSFAAEIEFEHGGTGSAVEFEPEEAGEFESEVEKGGEVILETLYLQYSHGPRLNFRVGELIVPVGMINAYHGPSRYFTIERSLAESSLIPVVWHESGIQLHGRIGQASYRIQYVTALDSTGFSGHEFVRGGMQRRLEVRNASAFAVVLQGEYAFGPGVMLGGAYYSGDSSPNRPRGELGVDARVTLAEIHGRVERGPLTVRGQWLVGRVQNSAAITRANLNTFNGAELGASRTAVGSEARSWFLEAGYDVFSLFDRGSWGRLDLFARYETYDTHAATAAGVVQTLRYDRQAMTIGINYKPQPGIVLKAEYSRRRHEGSVGNRQDFIGLGVGFSF